MKNELTKEILCNQIRDVLSELYSRDYDLIERHVHEQCVSACFWYYFKQKYSSFYDGLDIDIEYDKNGENPKRISADWSARPDFIIHKRKLKEYNLVCIEFKKENVKIENDYEKLAKLTSQFNETEEYTYHFRYGLSIVLKLDKKPLITWFENGNKGEQEEVELTISF